jgi:hypothetical protein
VKCIFVLAFAVWAAIGQTGTASIAGTLVDARTQKPVPAALILAVSGGPSPLTIRTKSGGDGAFQIQGIAAGKFSLCVQAAGDGYLDPCQWNGSPTAVTLVSGQVATGIVLRLTAASVLNIQVQDAQKILSQKTKDGRRPDLTLGIWGPRGLFYPAHALGNPGAAGSPQSVYRIGVPRDTALKVHISSRDLKLGDAAGVPLPANASQQAFQHATGDPNSKSFAFTVLGLLP